jgi:hypothetical protein
MASLLASGGVGVDEAKDLNAPVGIGGARLNAWVGTGTVADLSVGSSSTFFASNVRLRRALTIGFRRVDAAAAAAISAGDGGLGSVQSWLISSPIYCSILA